MTTFGKQPVLPGGIFPPVPTFFDQDEQLDLVTYQQHLRWLAGSGIAGYVVMGSNGEAVHLSHEERSLLIEMTHEVVQGLEQTLPVIVGCGAQSTRMTVEQCRQAARYGADYALILPPSYYRGRMSEGALGEHYRIVADTSPLPLVIYNMPNSAAGINLSADLICALAEHENIVAVKDTSGDVAKLMQIVAHTSPTFRVFAGNADVLLPALIGGAVGAVAALANLYPRTVCSLQTLCAQERLEEARILQSKLIPINQAVTTRYGVAGLKAALEHLYGYGGYPRLPLLPLTAQERERLISLLDAFPAEK
jgi:4-hydroxy-2-oxoglutarate aldolase